MTIEKFSIKHVEEAEELALSNYNEERSFVPILPDISAVPALSYFAETGSGAAMTENGRLCGYMCWYPPRENAFNTAARGVFSPIHAHGAVREKRDLIYKRLFQSTAEILAGEGAGSYALALYAHGAEAVNAMFTYGFGLRCVDAIRPMELIESVPRIGYACRRLAKGEERTVRGLRRSLSVHLSKSPVFMLESEEDFNEWIVRAENRDSRLYAAFDGEKAIAFIEVTDKGENFVSEVSDMRSICGAYCLPEYRGQGIPQNLLNNIIRDYKSEGYVRLGVDFESFNPAANGFWSKYFTAYTSSVVRRMDFA